MITISTLFILNMVTPAHAAIDYRDDHVAEGRLCTECQEKYGPKRTFAQNPPQFFDEQNQTPAQNSPPSESKTGK